MYGLFVKKISTFLLLFLPSLVFMGCQKNDDARMAFYNVAATEVLLSKVMGAPNQYRMSFRNAGMNVHKLEPLQRGDYLEQQLPLKMFIEFFKQQKKHALIMMSADFSEEDGYNTYFGWLSSVKAHHDEGSFSFTFTPLNMDKGVEVSQMPQEKEVFRLSLVNAVIRFQEK